MTATRGRLLGFFQRGTADPEAAADLAAEILAAALVSRTRYWPQHAGAAARRSRAAGN